MAKGKQGDTAGAIADCTAVIQLEGAPRDQIAQALNNRGVAKGKQGDTAGEIADYTAVIELEGAPRDRIAKALYNRGVAEGMRGDTQDAVVDFVAALRTDEAPPDLRTLAAARAMGDTLVHKNQEGAKETIAALREWLLGLPDRERIQRVVECLVALADFKARDAWLYTFTELLKGQPEETLKELEFLRPVADVLETGDMSKLDAIAPEQRDFALHILHKLGVPSAAAGEARRGAGS